MQQNIDKNTHMYLHMHTHIDMQRYFSRNSCNTGGIRGSLYVEACKVQSGSLSVKTIELQANDKY